MRFVSDVLLSAPSILIGLFIYQLVVLPMGGFSGWAGVFALAIIVIPVVVRTTEDMLQLIPNTLREAVIALGRAEVEDDRPGLLPGGPLRHRHRHPAGGGAHRRRDGAAAADELRQRDAVASTSASAMASLPIAIYQQANSGFPDLDRHRLVGRPARSRSACWPSTSSPASCCGAAADRTEKQPHEHHHRHADQAARRRPAASAACRRGPPPPRRASARVAIRDLDFFYGDNRALKGINLDLPDRQVTGMIGPSGCGKSTLLRVLNRMYSLYPGQRATGEVLLDGQNIIAADVDTNELRSKVGMVFQKPTPFPMTIHENIAFGVRLHEKLSKARDGRAGGMGAAPAPPSGAR